MATAATPPLYLRVTSTTKDGLEKAVKMIEEMMQQDLPNLVDERRFRRREPENFERDEFGRRKWPEEKIYVGLEPIGGFNLRAQVVGRSGDNVKYIQQETGCKVQIKGHGSGFLEHGTGVESDEPMYLHIAGPRPEGVAQAKALVEELLEKVKRDHKEHQERGPSHRSYGNRDGYNGRSGYGDRGERGDRGDRGDRDRDRSQSYGYGAGHYGAGQSGGYGEQSAYGAAGDARSPTAPASAEGYNASASDYNAQMAQWATYYAQYPDQDPYASQGGFAQVMAQYYQSVYGAGYAQTQSPTPGVGAGGAAPPPPPSDTPATGYGAPPPPPPPAASPPGGYNAVPPPPGI